MNTATTPLVQRIARRIDRRGPDECWPWTASTTAAGYPQISTSKKLRLKMGYAHRVLWEIVRGAIPPGYFVCHHCDNRRCMNMRHWFLGTHRDNMADMMNKGRQQRRRGEQQSRARLTEVRVMEIRKRRLDGEGYAAMAREFGLPVTTVRGAAIGRSWAFLPGALPGK